PGVARAGAGANPGDAPVPHAVPGVVRVHEPVAVSTRALVTEALGSALLLAAVVGSGIMGERLAGGNVAIALLANTLATGAALVALILAFGPLSGAHMNPAVTLADAAVGGIRWTEVPVYIAAQITGAFLGVAVAHGQRHLRGHPADGCTRLHRRAASGGSGGDALVSLAGPGTACGRAGRHGPSQSEAGAGMTERRVKMLFICTGNSARSQTAEGLTRAMSDGQVECYSAGTEPKPIHPLAIRAMAEVGLDISKNVSKGLAQFLDEDFDYVISVCARAAETCPTWPRSREQIRWHFDDPAEAAAPEEDRLRVFRRVRNEIQQRLS